MLRNLTRIAVTASRCPVASRPRSRVTAAAPSGRGYHSYPDPDEKGVETSTIAKNLKDRIQPQILDKKGKDFTLDGKFKISINGENAGFPGVPTGKSVIPGAGPAVQATVLPSGLTVASQDMPGLMTSFCFCVGAGSSYETQDGSANDNTGVTQLLEQSSFKSTSNRGANDVDVATRIAQLGGMVQCLASREQVIYCVDVLRSNAEPALDILADAIQRPLFLEEEVEEAKTVLRLMVRGVVRGVHC